MLVPPELRGSLSRFTLELVNRGLIVRFCLVTGAVSMFIFGRHPNGFVRTIPPILGPLLVALFLSVRPWNPFKSYFADAEGKYFDKFEHNPAVQRLVAMLASADARIVVWKTAVLLSMTLFGLVSAVSLLAPRPTSWDDWFTVAVAAALQGSMCALVFFHSLLRWALGRWQDQS